MHRIFWLCALVVLLEQVKVGAQAVVEISPSFSGHTWIAQGITSGPDGNLWYLFGVRFCASIRSCRFTDGVDNVVVMTTAGVVQKYFVTTTAASGPTAITTGPDSTMWFCEYNVGQIGMIDNTNAIFEYTITTPGGAPFDIVSAGGLLWFTDSANNNIDSITVRARFCLFVAVLVF